MDLGGGGPGDGYAVMSVSASLVIAIGIERGGCEQRHVKLFELALDVGAELGR